MTPLILFAIPSYTGAPCGEFMVSWTETLGALGQAGIPSGVCWVPQDPYLSKARNKAATLFLTQWPMATHLFFLDDDIGWPAQKVVEFIRRDVDLITGVYPKKTDNLEFPAQLMLEDGKIVERDGLLKAALAPTGFMCIKRHVLEKMAARSGQYLDTTNPAATEWQFNIFDNGFFMPSGEVPTNQGGVKGEFWGEDYYFVRKWRDLGGDVWIDPDIEFTHRGSKAWRGNFKSAIVAWQEQQKVEANGTDARPTGLAESSGGVVDGAPEPVQERDGGTGSEAEREAAD